MLLTAESFKTRRLNNLERGSLRCQYHYSQVPQTFPGPKEMDGGVQRGRGAPVNGSVCAPF